MSSQQFLELLYGQLPAFFADEEELRELWSQPETRVRLLQGLSERGFGKEQLLEIQRIINAENSDLYDVLAHVAYALAPRTRVERSASARVAISSAYSDKQRSFLEFVLGQYERVGVSELNTDKLSPLLRLKYNDAIAEAVADLGPPPQIKTMFVEFQQFLYAPPSQ